MEISFTVPSDDIKREIRNMIVKNSGDHSIKADDLTIIPLIEVNKDLYQNVLKALNIKLKIKRKEED